MPLHEAFLLHGYYDVTIIPTHPDLTCSHAAG
jgi:hypothetical protein